VTEEPKYLFKQRLGIVIALYLIAFAIVGMKTTFQIQIEWLYLLIIVPGVIYTVVIPYLKNETIILSAVFEIRDHVDKFFRLVLVFLSGVILFAFIFGKHG
tara:strand:+ start:78 stop:380 length:303 start_codon:yes stop_codon:yes gene_type:complete